jgi:hypothetical protein
MNYLNENFHNFIEEKFTVYCTLSSDWHAERGCLRMMYQLLLLLIFSMKWIANNESLIRKYAYWKRIGKCIFVFTSYSIKIHSSSTKRLFP